jgi:hypothetical protein
LYGRRLAFLAGDVRGAHRELAAVRHRVARVHREVHDHLLDLRDVGLHRPQVASVHRHQLDLFAEQPLEQHAEVGQRLAEIEHLRPQASGGARTRADAAPGSRRGWRSA